MMSKVKQLLIREGKIISNGGEIMSKGGKTVKIRGNND